MSEPGSTESATPQGPSLQELLSREDVKGRIGEFRQRFDAKPGEERLYGVTQSGKLVGVRSESDKGQFSGMVLDLKEEQGQAVEVGTLTGYVERFRDGGTVVFPTYMTRRWLEDESQKSDDELQRTYPDDPEVVSVIKFFRETGGFVIPQRVFPPFKEPKAGEEVLLSVK